MFQDSFFYHFLSFWKKKFVFSHSFEIGLLSNKCFSFSFIWGCFYFPFTLKDSSAGYRIWRWLFFCFFSDWKMCDFFLACTVLDGKFTVTWIGVPLLIMCHLSLDNVNIFFFCFCSQNLIMKCVGGFLWVYSLLVSCSLESLNHWFFSYSFPLSLSCPSGAHDTGECWILLSWFLPLVLFVLFNLFSLSCSNSVESIDYRLHWYLSCQLYYWTH